MGREEYMTEFLRGNGRTSILEMRAGDYMLRSIYRTVLEHAPRSGCFKVG
jgi:hypothetical protein